MLRTVTKTLVLAAAMIAFTSSSSAALIVDNGLPNQTGGSDLNSFLQAENFSLIGLTNINLIRFWTLQDNAASYAGTTEYSIRSNVAPGEPGSIVAFGSFVSTQVATGNSTLGLNEFRHEGAVNFNLAAGDYWLVLHNGPSSSTPTSNFYWAFTNDQAGDSESYELALGGAATWVTNGAELAFQLEGDTNVIPEPSTVLLSLAGFGVLAIGAARRKK